MRFTERLTSRSSGLVYEDLSEPVRAFAAHCLLDYFGVALAGAKEPLVEIVRAEVEEQGGAPMARLVGSAVKTSPANAALFNGTAGHALDYDDVNMAMPGHPTIAVLPALLALGEARHATGAEIITAFAAGYDLQCALGAAMAPGHYGKGFHSTGTLGALGAAAACARLLNLDAVACAHALSIASAQASGLKSLFGTMCKPFQAGKAAQNGLLSASLAARGFKGRLDPIECAQGFAECYGPDFHSENLLESPPGAHVVCTLFKYHASCYLTHAAIEAARRLIWDDEIVVENVAHVSVHVASLCDRVCNISAPRTGLEAKFSLRLTVAMALAGIDTSDPLAYTDEMAMSDKMIDVRNRVSVDVRDESWPENLAEVSIQLRDGRLLSATHDSGTPEEDLICQSERLHAKFMALTTPVMGAGQAREAVALAGSLTELDDISGLTQFFGRAF